MTYEPKRISEADHRAAILRAVQAAGRPEADRRRLVPAVPTARDLASTTPPTYQPKRVSEAESRASVLSSIQRASRDTANRVVRPVR